MVYITSLAIEKLQFNHFSIICLWDLSIAMATKQVADDLDFSCFKFSLPKENLFQIRVILHQWFWKGCHLKKSFFEI